jgi:hypothetical protein
MVACRLQAVVPKLEAVVAGNAQAGARDAVGAAALGRRWKIEEGKVCAGIGFAVGIEQMVCTDVILVDGLLHQPHAQQAGIERKILARLG